MCVHVQSTDDQAVWAVPWAAWAAIIFWRRAVAEVSDYVSERGTENESYFLRRPGRSWSSVLL